MSNIYDVAKIAGVSISTVSNYLNNKYISPEKRVLIQAAIKELDYVPNPSAKRLKTKASKQIAIILPNIEEQIYSEILTGINMTITQKGYRFTLYLTDDMQSDEHAYIAECLNADYAGVYLCTCNPTDRSLFTKLLKKCPVVFILRKPKGFKNYNYIGFNDYETINNITNYFLSQNHEDICLLTGPLEYSNEQACLSGYTDAFIKNGKVIDENNIIHLPQSRESIFQYIIKKFKDGFRPKLIITSSLQIANATIEASLLQDIKLQRDINILSLSEDNWYNFESLSHTITTNRPAKKLGMFAGNVMLDNISNIKSFEHITKSFKDDFLYNKLKDIAGNIKRFTSISVRPIYENKIRLLLTQNDNISETIQYCLPEFVDKTHIDVTVDTMPQNKIYDKLMDIKENKSDTYDVIAVDVPWLSYFAQNNCLKNLSDSFDRNYLNRLFSQDTISKFGEYQGQVYGIPYLNAMQFLYYRKDVFFDESNQRKFKATYGIDLKAPTTWHEYNLIARFFTKKYNPESAFEYGTCITRKFNQALMGELYPRIWAYGGDIFDRQGNITVYSDENIKAFTSMVNSLKCTDDALFKYSAYEKTIAFAKGDFPMIIAYHHHAAVISDRNISEVIGKVGYDKIPGSSPILAGWSMGINAYSKQENYATRFLEWLLTAQSSISYTILGGNSAVERIYSNPDLIKLYPWLSLVPSSVLDCKPRNTPLFNGEIIVSEAKVEDILANVVYGALKKDHDIQSLLQSAHNEIKDLFYKNGYSAPLFL
jgi:multiple sugar transport system substrate-binding protein